MDYEHVQWSWLAPVVVVLAAVGLIGLVGAGNGSAPVVMLGSLAILVALAALVLLSRLVVTVGNGRVTAAFGLGWPRRIVDLAEVTCARQVRNRWWYGLGIRWVPHGWMFNVWGLDAVELQFPSGRVFRIGTNDPENLLAAVESPR